MNLDVFIRESLLEVLKGIKTAQEITNEQGAGVGVINPKWGNEKDHYRYESEVAFDIAISVTEQKSGGGKAGIKVVGLELGGGGDVSIENNHVSRLSFKLRVAFPSVAVTDVPALRDQ